VSMAPKIPQPASGRVSAGIRGNSKVTKETVVRVLPSAHQAAPGPLAAGEKARGKAKQPAGLSATAPSWMQNLVKGLDVTTQFLKPVKSHMFDWQAVADSNEFTIQNKAVIKDKIQFVVLKAT